VFASVGPSVIRCLFKDFTFIAAGRPMLAHSLVRRATSVCLPRSRLIVGSFGCRPAVIRPTTPYTARPRDRGTSDRRQGLLPFLQAQPDCSKLAVRRDPQSPNGGRRIRQGRRRDRGKGRHTLDLSGKKKKTDTERRFLYRGIGSVPSSVPPTCRPCGNEWRTHMNFAWRNNAHAERSS
jgi:hypothetical protein